MRPHPAERSWGVVAVSAWAVLVLLGALVVGALQAAEGTADLEALSTLLISFLFAGLGWLVAIRQPGNAISWVLLAPATFIVIEGAAILRLGDVAPDPVAVWDNLAIVWLNTGWWFALIVPLFLLLYIFPTGRFLTRRWSWAGWLAALVAAIAVFVEGFSAQLGPNTADWTVPNPIGFLGFSGLEEAGGLALVFGFGLVSLLIGGIVAIVVRYHRSATATRTQIKWVVFALILSTTTLMSQILVESYQGFFAVLMFFIALSILPVTVTIAITKYRLYEIDRLISRTLSYGLLVALLGVVFAALTWLPSFLIGGLGDGGSAASAPPVVIAGSTLAVAALFNPVRKRMQHAVDRRFNRSAYRADAISEQFAVRLQEALTVEEIAAAWTSVVSEALQPQAAGIWLKQAYSNDSGN